MGCPPAWSAGLALQPGTSKHTSRPTLAAARAVEVLMSWLDLERLIREPAADPSRRTAGAGRFTRPWLAIPAYELPQTTHVHSGGVPVLQQAYDWPWQLTEQLTPPSP